MEEKRALQVDDWAPADETMSAKDIVSYGVGTFVRKFVGAFATLIVGVLLEWAGYVAGAITRPIHCGHDIKHHNIGAPILLFGITAALIALYPITPTYGAEMRAKLREIRGGP